MYKAIHKGTGDTRAVKFIDKASVQAEDVSKLLKEINILKTLV